MRGPPQDFLRVIDHDNDIAGVIAAKDFMLDLRCAGGFRIRILPAFLAHAVTKFGAEGQEEEKN